MNDLYDDAAVNFPVLPQIAPHDYGAVVTTIRCGEHVTIICERGWLIVPIEMCRVLCAATDVAA